MPLFTHPANRPGETSCSRRLLPWLLCLVLASGCATLTPPGGEDQEPGPGADAAVTGNTDNTPVANATASDAVAPEAFELSDTVAPPQPEAQVQPEPAVPLDLWARLREGLELDRHLHERRVQSEIAWYRRNPAYIQRVTKRASLHLYHIVGELDARNMPLDIALLPIVESAFDPYAYSHGRASGLWQFIPGTARLYGLKIDWWYDGRRDVRASTRAALDYLTYLSTLYDGDWLLALAAYNSGQGNVNAAIRKNRRLGKPEDFWHLPVPRETSAYVPRLLAITEIITRPEHYGVSLHPIANEPVWEVVDVGSQLDLTRAAELADVDNSLFYRLNPAFNQWSTHPEGPHELLLPLDRVDSFRSGLAMIPAAERLAWTRHKIRSGESLGSIAKRYRTSVASLKAVNGLTGDVIIAGDSLLIPVAREDVSYPMTDENRLATRQAQYEKRYGAPRIHTVKPGDSFWKLSRDYGVGMRELARWNGKGTTSVLRAGETLKIYKTAGRPAEVRKVNYRVRKGESLALIADRFNVSVSAIRNWNDDLDGKYIHPGDRITLYVDVTATD